MSEQEFLDLLQELIVVDTDEGFVRSAKTFIEDGLLSSANGLRVILANGSEFLMHIIRTK